jgi:hypothetical protein
MPPNARIERICARSFRIPTDVPESDGTMAWDATTLVIVTVEAIGQIGPWIHLCGAAIVDNLLSPVLKGKEAFDVPGLWVGMVRDGLRDIDTGNYEDPAATSHISLLRMPCSSFLLVEQSRGFGASAGDLL